MPDPDPNPVPVVGAAAAPPNFTMDPFDRKKLQWSRWVERLETALSIYGVVNEEMRRNLLLHHMGPESYDVICDKLAPASPRTKTFQEIVQLIEAYYNPQPLEISENYRFNCRRQGDKEAGSADETVDEYLVALRRIAITCNFGTYLEKALRNQLVFGIKRNDIRSRLLEKRDLTLQDAREIAVGIELSRRGGAEIEGNMFRGDVNAVHRQSEKKKVHKDSGIDSDKSCYRCGAKSHLANVCRHKDTECLFCKQTGHLARVCMQKAKSGQSANKHKSAQSSAQSNYVDEPASADNTNDIKVQEVCVVDKTSGNEKFWFQVRVNKVDMNFEVDTGSPVSIINERVREKYFRNVCLRKSDLSLVSYCGTSIAVLGVLDTVVEVQHQSVVLPLYVAKSDKHPLLGREWLKELPVDWNKVLRNPNAVNVLSAMSGWNSALGKVLDKYPKVFEDKIGKISSVQAKLPLKENVKPVCLKARKIPFSLQTIVEMELDKLVAEGVLTKVNQSNWATPIVPVKKSQNRVRICGDYKQTVNPKLVVDKHPLPTVDELFASLAGGQKFTKIDLVQAYLQMEVAPEDREILTLSTHRGLYRPNRLMYGVASAPAIWQRQVESILQGIDGVEVFLDDIKISAPDDETHLVRLDEVLQRLDKCGIRVNKDKCVFLADQIEYCGYLIDKEGIHKLREKVDAVQGMPRPKNRDEVRSFVGLVNYYGRFFKNLSTVLYPLNNLLKQDVPFNWNKECEQSFLKVKELIQSGNCLVHYSPELPLILATDASPYGVGAVLSHIMPDGSERPIQFASQTLNRTQQRYMQIDKEAYAIIFGVKKFFQYLYGRKFILISDNQAITKIFGEHRGLPVMSALRMQHYATYLQSFDYEIRFRKSTDNANADAFSRIPLDHTDAENTIEETDVIEMNQIDTLPLTAAELAQATSEESSLRVLIKGLRYGQVVEAKDRFRVDQNEFSLQNGCLLRGIRVYVPSKLRSRVLEELHSAHFGITRTKSLARGYCWWVGIDREIEEMIANCADCQAVRAESTKMTLHCWEPPTEPFQRVHVDFAGPFLDTYFFIYVDAYSKWPIVMVCKSITAENTINMCREIFATYGIPSVLVSDHGVQFTAATFQRFLQMNGVTHKMGAPYHPATNGQAERYVQTMKQKLKALKYTKAEMNLELSNILLTYRKMIHPSTGKSPSMLVFGRQMRSRLDLLLPKNEPRENKNFVVRQFHDGDPVRVRDFLSNDKWKFGKIVEKVGKLRYSVRLDDGRIWERHIDHIAGVGANLQGKSADTVRNEVTVERCLPVTESSTPMNTPARTVVSEECIGDAIPATEVQRSATPAKLNPDVVRVPWQSAEHQSTEGNQSNMPLRRSSRTIKPPQRLNL